MPEGRRLILLWTVDTAKFSIILWMALHPDMWAALTGLSRIEKKAEGHGRGRRRDNDKVLKKRYIRGIEEEIGIIIFHYVHVSSKNILERIMQMLLN